MNYELIFIKFFELFFTFWINQIINFPIHPNEFRTNPSYSWSRNELKEFQINFHRIFRIFFALSNQSNCKFLNRIEQISNEFQFASTPPTYLSNLWIPIPVLLCLGHGFSVYLHAKRAMPPLCIFWCHKHDIHLIVFFYSILLEWVSAFWWSSLEQEHIHQ